uniref:Uncharacterized protein n=1 Tax=Chlamydomonas euryale TaxID=1486919 RepID=A0A7R9VZ39_9CHLO|mmetsp:Transcript_7113/g.21713  ORF Transcript_7113/g.21713 Transcript_7113/m.21713 type:complete len:149 (+) Transcript_7113:482-928(+)
MAPAAASLRSSGGATARIAHGVHTRAREHRMRVHVLPSGSSGAGGLHEMQRPAPGGVPQQGFRPFKKRWSQPQLKPQSQPQQQRQPPTPPTTQTPPQQQPKPQQQQQQQQRQQRQRAELESHGGAAGVPAHHRNPLPVLPQRRLRVAP